MKYSSFTKSDANLFSQIKEIYNAMNVFSHIKNPSTRIRYIWHFGSPELDNHRFVVKNVAVGLPQC